MRTVFITSFHPLISRNILSTGLISKLTSKNYRVVVLGPAKKKAFFERELDGSGAIFEGIDIKFGWQDMFLRYLALASVNTNTLRIKRLTEMKGSGKMLSRIIGNTNIGFQLTRFLNNIILPDAPFPDFFKKYNPDLVFSTDVQNEFDTRLITYASGKGIKTIGMVRSWDNLTSKGLIRHMPDILTVNNEIAKNEAQTYHKIDTEKIRVVGIPHYDNYLKRIAGAKIKKEDFFKKIGADPKKKLLVFAPLGDRYMPGNTLDRDVLDIIDDNLDIGWQILVRLPPMDNVSHLSDQRSGDRIIFYQPKKEFATLKNNEISKEEDGQFADTLYFCDLVVTVSSTIIIDAALFDKPVILAGFDGYASRPYKESVSRYYEYDHLKPVISSGGAPLGRSAGEFIALLKDYTGNPMLSREERREMLLVQCQFIDGKSTDRLVDLILKEI